MIIKLKSNWEFYDFYVIKKWPFLIFFEIIFMKITFYFKAEFCSQPSEKIQNLKIRQIEADQKSPIIKAINLSKALQVTR